MMKFEKEFKLAKSIILDVGADVLRVYNRNIISSIGKDTKAEADIKAEKAIMDRLQTNSEFEILSEESFQKFKPTETPFWIIDPIDGTLNFTRSIPFSCISIALWMQNEPIFGLIYDFNRTELYSSYVGVGAWLNSDELMKPKAINKQQSILSTGISTYLNLDNDGEGLKEFITQIISYKKVRLFGSAALSLAFVAANRVNAYMEKDIKLWDVAAGISLLKSLHIPIEYKKTNTGEYSYNVYGYNHIEEK